MHLALTKLLQSAKSADCNILFVEGDKMHIAHQTHAVNKYIRFCVNDIMVRITKLNLLLKFLFRDLVLYNVCLGIV